LLAALSAAQRGSVEEHGMYSKEGCTMKVGNNWRVMGAAAVMSVLTVVGVASPALAQAPASKPADMAAMQKKDLIIFKTGNKVEGVVLEETETTVKFLLIVGSMRSPTVYDKSDILEIKRDEFKTDASDSKSDPKKDDAKGDSKVDSSSSDGEKSSSAGTYDNPVDVEGKPIAPGTLKVYLCELGGEFGRDVSKSPVKAMMEDLIKAQPDIVIFRFNNTFGAQGQQTVDFDHQGAESYTTIQLERALQIDTLITPILRDDPRLVKKPKVVAWINKALGGAAFLPLVFHDIYFTSDGHQGGVGGLDLLFEGVGDEVVRQKQRSLRLAWVEGMANEGEFDKGASTLSAEELAQASRRKIAKAMCWGDYVLSYQIVGGQVKFLENQMPPNAEWFVLKDDGPINKNHADTMQDMVRMKGNDYLTLDAKTAFDIGYSKGTADTVTDLMSQMGVQRGFAVMRNHSPQIFRNWSKDVSKTENEVIKLLRELKNVEVKPPGQYEQRTEARGRKLRILEQLRSIIGQYKESLNPRKIRFSPEQGLDQIDEVIDRIKTEQTLDRRP
jgi:hypothetical protein